MVFGRMNPFSRSGGQESEAEATHPSDEAESGDTQDSVSSERPGIADKVRFWEEQDRINRELIPRVLKQNELLSSHVASHEEVRVQTTTLNARVDEMAERHKAEMAELEARMGAEVRSSNRFAILVSMASAGIAFLAVILALVA